MLEALTVLTQVNTSSGRVPKGRFTGRLACLRAKITYSLISASEALSSNPTKTLAIQLALLIPVDYLSGCGEQSDEWETRIVYSILKVWLLKADGDKHRRKADEDPEKRRDDSTSRSRPPVRGGANRHTTPPIGLPEL